MTVDPTHLTSAYDNVDRSTYTTASISPTANRWLVVDVVNRQGTATAPLPTLTGLDGGSTLTWVEEATHVYTGGLRRIARFYAWTGSSPGSGTIDIALGATATGCHWIVYEMGADVDTSDPFVQTNAAQVNASSITGNFGAFSSADNRPLHSAWHAGNTASSPEAGFTEIADTSGASPDSGFAVAFHPSSPDETPVYSWTGTVNAMSLASEIKAAAAGPTVHERAASVGATAVLVSAGTFFSVLDRASAFGATASVASAGLHIAERSAAIGAATSVEASAQFWSIFERAASLGATAGITSAGEIEGPGATVHSRSASLSALSGIAITGQRTVLRAVALGAIGAIDATGLIAHQRAVSLEAVSAIASDGHGELNRSVLISVIANISATPEAAWLPVERRSTTPVARRASTSVPRRSTTAVARRGG